MKASPPRSTFRPASTLLGLVLFCLAVATAESATGSVRGRVSSAENKSYLQGTHVAIEELRLSTYTDRDGEFLLAGVPVGSHQLRVNYTGLTNRTVPVTISADATARLDVELGAEVHQLQAFSVTADNVKNVVAADAFGSAGEGNVADLLQRLSYSTNLASLRYNPGQGRIDLSARFKLTRNLDLYGDAINVTAGPIVFQGPMPGRRDRISDYGAKVSFGLSGRY